MSRKRRSTAASGANEDDAVFAAFDTEITQRWKAWRDFHPVRGKVLQTHHDGRPNKDAQRAWHCYTL